jgi:hypothetical protein
MANTIIQIKRSSATQTPVGGSLSAAEPAYSYLSEKLFLGDASGTGIVEIGGKYWVDQTIRAFDQANAAFIAANTGNNEAVFAQANTARDHANAAYEQANSANVLAYNSAIAANAYTVEVGTAGNNYTITVGAAANGWANTISSTRADASNTYADSVGAAANSYANATFVKLNDGNQTITGDINITGNLFVTGNTTTVGSKDLVIEDPLFLLANNNITDIVDIGFVAHYANATSEQVHTGLIRDPGTKQWYLFKEYNDHFLYQGGNIDLSGNNFTIDTLNANFVTNNLILGGANAILTIGASYDKANAANVLAFNSAIAANAYADAVGAAGNSFAISIGTAGNNYTITVGAAANGWANTISSTRADASNAYASSVGAAANAYADAVGAAANTNAANGSYISAGVVKVPYGGTGATSFVQNGILFGNTAGDLKVTNAGTEGQVLQASATGVPQFGMLDGGVF